MDFNKVFEQMFSENGGNKNINPMQYANMLGTLSGSGNNNNSLLLILLLLLCCCGNNGFGNNGFGNCGGCSQNNNQCFEVCCRRKKHRCKNYKNYECYLNPCCCNSNCNCGGNNGFGCGCSWIWILLFIILICGCREKPNCKCSDGSCTSGVINVDTAE